MSKQLTSELADDLRQFLRNYYDNEVKQLAQRYPNEQRSLEVDWADLYQYDPDVADDFLNQPDYLIRHFEDALHQYDLPIDVTLSNATVRVVNLNETEVYSPIELVRENPKGYVGVRGELSKVTTPLEILEEGAFECQLCSTITRMPQTGDEVQEPHECQGCQRQGPFRVNRDQSEFEYYCKVRVETPPDESGELQSEFIDGFVQGDLVWEGHEDYGLVARTGEAVTVYGQTEERQKTGKGENNRLFEKFFDVGAIEFDGDQDEVNIEEHRDEFEKFAGREDAVDIFAESLVPSLYATPEWEHALELLVAYLFAAPRLDVEDGPTYRGDIHVLIISDYGMGKSMTNSAVARYSPKCIKESVTGMSSDVSLLAAAVEDDFGAGQWTLKPGILVRANGGHVILDEIDKTDADLERMNNALEGEQIVDVNKAGESATYKSRVGLLATGNPKESRFDKNEPISDQLDLDQSLLSRFDGIVTMEDEADEEQDGHIAQAQGMSILEAQELEFGDRDELDRLDRVVKPDVGRAWIAHARENCHPLIKEDHIDQIKEWYASDVRQLNKKFSSSTEEGGDMPVPVSARVVANTIRFATAFARVNLRDEVAQADVDRAMNLSKTLVGQQFDGDKFVPEEARRSSKPESQKDEYDELEDVIDNLSGADGAHIDEVITEASKRGMDRSDVEHKIEKMLHEGRLYEPSTDILQTTD